MHLIGILGGVASGKSLVARHLARLGAGVLDADAAGHEVLRLPEVEAAARERWGAAVFGSDGRIDRGRLARIVFAAEADAARERAYLEQLVHPEIGRRLQQRAEAMAAEGVKAAVLDAPLLLEAGWDEFCDKLIFVDAPRRLRLARAKTRGWSEEDFASREAVQQSLDSKRERAELIVDNCGTPQQTEVQVDRIWQSLAELKP
ncbi:MAG: dephospho-CoA kinase [Candidatus Nealsonbacteria bacterium]|nr:dephospho-CoA kinase [Candidatus Nealsonbacteria bacterium]